MKFKMVTMDTGKLRGNGFILYSGFSLLLLYFFFFLPLVPVGVAGGHSYLSAARRVAWRRDIP